MDGYPTPSSSEEEVLSSSLSKMATSSTFKIPDEVVRDPDFFLQTAVFKVEDVLFSVPRERLTESEGPFQDMFSLPQSGGANLEGSSAENPIQLLGEKAEDFRALFRILYPKEIPVTYDFITLSEWQSILYLSTKYNFDKVRDLAITRMSTLLGSDPLNRLILGKQYGIRSWFKAACISFINRHDGPTPEEANQMGLETAIKIYQTREPMLRSRSVYDAGAAVERQFKDELGPSADGTTLGDSSSSSRRFRLEGISSGE